MLQGSLRRVPCGAAWLSDVVGLDLRGRHQLLAADRELDDVGAGFHGGLSHGEWDAAATARLPPPPPPPPSGRPGPGWAEVPLHAVQARRPSCRSDLTDDAAGRRR